MFMFVGSFIFFAIIMLSISAFFFFGRSDTPLVRKRDVGKFDMPRLRKHTWITYLAVGLAYLGIAILRPFEERWMFVALNSGIFLASISLAIAAKRYRIVAKTPEERRRDRIITLICILIALVYIGIWVYSDHQQRQLLRQLGLI